MKKINQHHQRDEFFEFIRNVQQQADLDPQEADRLAAEAVVAPPAENQKTK